MVEQTRAANETRRIKFPVGKYIIERARAANETRRIKSQLENIIERARAANETQRIKFPVGKYNRTGPGRKRDSED